MKQSGFYSALQSFGYGLAIVAVIIVSVATVVANFIFTWYILAALSVEASNQNDAMVWIFLIAPPAALITTLLLLFKLFIPRHQNQIYALWHQRHLFLNCLMFGHNGYLPNPKNPFFRLDKIQLGTPTIRYLGLGSHPLHPLYSMETAYPRANKSKSHHRQRRSKPQRLKPCKPSPIFR